MKVIPHGQTAGPVRVCFVGDDGMVYAVKARRHDDASHEPLDANRQFDIRVMKQDREEEDVLPAPQCVGWNADCRNLHRPPWNRECELAGMKPECGRSIEIAIDVMNEVEPPQPRYTVREHVPHVQG